MRLPRDLNWHKMTLEELRRSMGEPTMPGRLVICVGLPASGKSRVSESFADAGYLRLNNDKIRGELFGDERIQGQGVYSVFLQRLEVALAGGENIVVDNTNVNPGMRLPVLERARRAGYRDIHLLLIDTPVSECVRRDRARERTVGKAVIRQFAKTLRENGLPHPSEGCLYILRPGPDRDHYLVAVPYAGKEGGYECL